ncbi:MAG TPA: DNA replication/repair protein RecF [Gammaproteobacteria bacterium]|nr:DNA replication/repair protein RecF [Gammaproteobacteria bacterium]
METVTHGESPEDLMGVIERFDLRNVRIIDSASIQPSPRINLIYGGNASGKSSLLEAIHILALGRSFRTHQISRVVSTGATSMILFAQLGRARRKQLSVGAERGEKINRLRIGGRTVRTTAELARELPVQIISPEIHDLIEQGPVNRRRFLDWGLFHVEHGFMAIWKRFAKALQQRNAGLRSGLPDAQISVWHAEMGELGQELDRMRRGYIERLLPLAQKHTDVLLGGASRLKIRYMRGWRERIDYTEYLSGSLETDRQFGHTRQGPHRADLEMFIDEMPVRDRLSRGEQKMLGTAMRLAQVELLRTGSGLRSVLLVDDLAAELDAERRRRLVGALDESGCQVFVTATDPGSLGEESGRIEKMFHVEHGALREVV